MIRCQKCIYPSSKPELVLDSEGICSACRSFDSRKSIDWSERKKALEQMLAEVRGKAEWDVVVPASGGKDSTFQVLTMLEMGAKPLVVVAATDYLTDIGRRNIDNLKNYADVVEVTPNLEVRKKLVRIGLRVLGDLSYPEHCAIWSLPTRVALAHGIPLICWGENPQVEYSGTAVVREFEQLDRKWAMEYGGMQGLRAADLVGQEGLTERDLAPFVFPDGAERVRSFWLGRYLDWDGWRNAFIVQQYGFEVWPTPVEQSAANYENVDSYVTVLRDWTRACKFGYARATDIVCNHIRRGRLTRTEGLRIIAARERFPQTSLGKPISEVLAYFGLTVDEYVAECDKWTNPRIFQFKDGRPVKDSDGTPRMLSDA